DVGFAAACGAVQARRLYRTLPVNFLAPKKTRPKSNLPRRYALAGAAAAALITAGVAGFYFLAVGEKESQIQELQAQVSRNNKTIDAFADTEKKLDAINAWVGNEVVVLDELYDLTAHFPDR